MKQNLDSSDVENMRDGHKSPRSTATDILQGMQGEFADKLSSPLLDVQVTVHVIVGSTRKRLSDLLELAHGQIVPLDQRIGDSVSIMVNGCIIATGELVISDETDAQIGVTVTSVPEKP